MREEEEDKVPVDSKEALEWEELKSIESGLKDFEEGRTHPHEEVRKIYEKYL